MRSAVISGRGLRLATPRDFPALTLINSPDTTGGPGGQ